MFFLKDDKDVFVRKIKDNLKIKYDSLMDYGLTKNNLSALKKKYAKFMCRN